MDKPVIKPIHPFPARMAPEIAFHVLKDIKKGSTILDPMAGSGTVLRTISELGFTGIGFDIDPLAVLMSKAWTTKVYQKNFIRKAEQVVREAQELQAKSIRLSWIDEDKPTKEFINFWFGQKQIRQLRKLSYLINKEKGVYACLLKIALSRLIITKKNGASLAADVSHSRPHKVMNKNNFDVMSGFILSCSRIAKILAEKQPKGKVNIKLGDARRLTGVRDNSIDFIITSPPYLNALDYLRGHKLSLVWLGHTIGQLSSIRGDSVGAEKAPDSMDKVDLAKSITKKLQGFHRLPSKEVNMIYRYALDMYDLMKESFRVLKKGSNATFVVGNSSIKGIHIKNTTIVMEAARKFGFQVTSRRQRVIPDSRRYLPPPNKAGKSILSRRMRTETVITFIKN